MYPYSIHVVLEQELRASWKARQALYQLSTSLAQFYLLLPVLGGVHIYARYSSVFIPFVVSKGQGKVCLKLGIICEVVSQGKPHSIYKKWRFNVDNKGLAGSSPWIPFPHVNTKVWLLHLYSKSAALWVYLHIEQDLWLSCIRKLKLGLTCQSAWV